MTQDGALTYGYDKNGNRTSIRYPGGVAADSPFDFADRESTLAVTSPAGTQPVVTASSYLPSGPLASLSLGNGANETRSFTTRYLPQAIALDAARERSYTFATDAVGNVTSITEAVECLADVALSNRTVTGTEAMLGLRTSKGRRRSGRFRGPHEEVRRPRQKTRMPAIRIPAKPVVPSPFGD